MSQIMSANRQYRALCTNRTYYNAWHAVNELTEELDEPVIRIPGTSIVLRTHSDWMNLFVAPPYSIRQATTLLREVWFRLLRLRTQRARRARHEGRVRRGTGRCR